MVVAWTSFHRLPEDNVKKYTPIGAGVYLLWFQLNNNKWKC